MRTLIAIFATLSCLSAPVVAQVAAAPQFISLYPDADPTYTEGIVIPAGSPVQLVAFPRDWGSTAEFRGQFTLTGTYEIEGHGEDAVATFRPDRGSKDQLPYWHDRGGPDEIYILNSWEFAQSVASKEQLVKLEASDPPIIRGQATIVADDYVATIECDSANFTARFVSVVNAVELASLPPADEGC